MSGGWRRAPAARLLDGRVSHHPHSAKKLSAATWAVRFPHWLGIVVITKMLATKMNNFKVVFICGLRTMFLVALPTGD